MLLTGLPNAGKTTLADELKRSFEGWSIPAQVLDGDVLRERLPPAIGFADADRIAQAERALFIAELLHDHGIATLLALVMPFAASRRRFAQRFGSNFTEVFLDCPIDELVERDSRGTYAAAAARGDARYESVVAGYERPASPDLTIDTSGLPIDAALAQIVSAVFAATPARTSARRRA